MSLFAQIFWGSALLIACALAHVLVVAYAMPVLIKLAHHVRRWRVVVRHALLLSFAVSALVLGHTVQIWSWAVVMWRVDAFEDFPESFYFATATYTTLGYGDLILGPGLRVFASFASITGLLTFGISTGLLVSIVSRMLTADDRAF